MTTVVVPYRGGCEHREAAWEYVHRRYLNLGYDVVVGTCEGPWRKAVAVRDAIQQTDDEVLVVADADVWCDTLPLAVEQVEGGAVWAIPHWRVHRLTRHATMKVLAGGVLCGETEELPYAGVEGGGLVVIRRDLWHLAPMDTRFVGWGQEDEAWGISLRAHAGRIRRVKGHLWHLWHPPQPRDSRGIGSAESLELFKEYVHHPDRAFQEARRALQEA